ncbi:MAG: hypothetical protein ACMXYA_02165 [Candidatus Woesearchaeota archaeon]
MVDILSTLKNNKLFNLSIFPFDMLTQAFMNKIYGISNRSLSKDLKKKRVTLIQHTYHASEEYGFWSLKEKLTPVEFLAFLPIQYYRRFHHLQKVRALDQKAFVIQSIKRGLQSLAQFHDSEDELLPGIPTFTQEHSDVSSLEKRITTLDDDEKQLLKKPGTLFLTNAEYNIKEEELKKAGSSIDEYILTKQSIMIRNFPKRKNAPQMMLQLYAVRDKFNTKPKKPTVHKPIKTEPPKIHPTISHALKSKELFHEFFQNKDKAYNIPLFLHFFQGLIEYSYFDKQQDVLECAPFLDAASFFTTTHFLRHGIPKKFDDVKYLEPDALFAYCRENPTMRYHIQTLKRHFGRKKVHDWEMILNQYASQKKPYIDIEKLWFAPKLRFGSPTKAKRTHIDIIVPNYRDDFLNIPDAHIYAVERKTVESCREYLKNRLLAKEKN